LAKPWHRAKAAGLANPDTGIFGGAGNARFKDAGGFVPGNLARHIP
jgi:hypothetical protein